MTLADPCHDPAMRRLSGVDHTVVSEQVQYLKTARRLLLVDLSRAAKFVRLNDPAVAG